MPVEIKLPYTPYRKQYEFIKANKRYNFYSGAYRGGKTLALVLKCFEKMVSKNANIFLGCHTYPMLRRVIYPYLFTIMDVIPHKYWSLNKADKIITWHHSKQSKSFLHLGHLQDENAVAGMSLTDYALDEGTRGINERTFIQLNSRLSAEGAQAHIAANPDAITHFLYKFFFLKKDLPDRCIIQAKTKHNPFLPADYLKDLDNMPEEWKRRYMDGEWGYAEGAVYKEFSHGNHVFDFENPQSPCPDDCESQSGWEYFLCMDWGWNDPFACLLVGKGRDSNFFVIDEVYKRETLNEELISIVKDRWMGEYKIDGMVCDTSEPRSIEQFEQGLKVPRMLVHKNIKKRTIGISSVRRKLLIKPSGYPSLIIHPRCHNLIREFQSYKWKEDKDGNPREETQKKDDHGLDALRYLIYSFERNVV